MRFFILLVSFLFVCPVWAGDGLVVDGWARATASKARNGAVYLSIKGNGATTDRLLSARSDGARRVALHAHEMDGGVMKMRLVDSLEIPATGGVEMRPGQMHLMLMGLKAPLGKGSSVPLTVTFEKAGTMTLEIKILGMGAKGVPVMKKHTH